MATGDRYGLEISSMTSLIHSWEGGSETAAKISHQLATIHDQLVRSIPSALVEGLLGQVPLMECFAKLAAATEAASAVSQGLKQDTSTLRRNLSGYVAAEQEAEAKLKAVQAEKAAEAAAAAQAEKAKQRAAADGRSQGGGDGASSGGGSGGGGLQPPGPALYANQVQVEEWIDQAFRVLEANGVPASALDEAGVLLIIEHESSGNPNAINNWDSNAQAGDPSRGLMQTIGATFDAYKLPGHEDIYNPVDNVIAGVRYAISRYGSIQNIPGVKAVNNGGSYVGY
jgi:soluble lytic murein transglycosylase-like protein